VNLPTTRHQPLVKDDHRTIRFKANAIVRVADDRKRLSKLYAELRNRVEDFYHLAVRNEKAKQA
jgi:hypothetical protein